MPGFVHEDLEHTEYADSSMGTVHIQYISEAVYKITGRIKSWKHLKKTVSHLTRHWAFISICEGELFI